jgi:hypothetical protein
MEKSERMKPTSKKKENLTLKRSRLLQELPTSKSVAEAGKKAGYACRQSAHEALKSISEGTPEVLERLGLTRDYVLDKCLRPLFEAKIVKRESYKGIVMETFYDDALDIRLRTIDIWAKLMGAYTQKVQISGSIDHHGIDLSEVPDAVLQRIVELAQNGPAGSGQGKG